MGSLGGVLARFLLKDLIMVHRREGNIIKYAPFVFVLFNCLGLFLSIGVFDVVVDLCSEFLYI